MKKKTALVVLIPFFMLWMSCGTSKQHASSKQIADWSTFSYPQVVFTNLAQQTEGSQIYNRLVPNPEELINESILEVVKTLYWSPSDSIPNIQRINYTLENTNGISAKSGGVPEISIFYSTKWVELVAQKADDKRVLYETEGVLYHELVHGFQLEPQGIGSYGTNKVFFAFIEGMADAVRAHNGYFPLSNRKPGGHWMDGYQTTGFFLQWLTNKDADFLRKFNRSTLTVVPWSFEEAIKETLGQEYDIQSLWDEYQKAISSDNS